MSLEKCSRLAGLRLPHIVTNDYAYTPSRSARTAIWERNNEELHRLGPPELPSFRRKNAILRFLPLGHK